MHHDEQGRPVPPDTGTEVETLRSFLDFQRRTLVWKTSGLDAAGLTHRLSPTTMTLGGLLSICPSWRTCGSGTGSPG